MLDFEHRRIVFAVAFEALQTAFSVVHFPLLLISLGRNECTFPDYVFPFVDLFEDDLDFGVFGFGSGMRLMLRTRRCQSTGSCFDCCMVSQRKSEPSCVTASHAPSMVLSLTRYRSSICRCGRQGARSGTQRRAPCRRQRRVTRAGWDVGVQLQSQRPSIITRLDSPVSFAIAASVSVIVMVAGVGFPPVVAALITSASRSVAVAVAIGSVGLIVTTAATAVPAAPPVVREARLLRRVGRTHCLTVGAWPARGKDVITVRLICTGWCHGPGKRWCN